MLLKRVQTKLPLPNIYLEVSRSIKKQTCWEDEDCCGKKLHPPKHEKIVVEKACCPCPFIWYEHKKPVLKPRPKVEIEVDDGIPKEMQWCYPGKVIPQINFGKVKEDGIKCLARTTVAASLKMGGKICPKKGVQTVKYMKLDDFFKNPKIPEATWNTDCQF
ncbi:unnamed protein product [Brassicogethes aeneus]|uniref:Uncharacterized protein n=1 Tax=Brassicogethes aeneus TaxID=1431903 RepID=A0A9P0FGQ1_BRAAE|nr:unnamed protein product [Brassicogethes aeneus]